MPVFNTLATLTCFAFTSGIRLYLTVAVIGIVSRFNLVAGLPPEFEVLGQSWVIILALLLALIEFVVDKVEWLDSAWDSVHTFIRPIATIFLVHSSISDANPELAIILPLLAGTITLVSHTGKAGTRAMVNTSPEPASNILVSLAEDVGMVTLITLTLTHPVIALSIVAVLLLVIIWLLPKLVSSVLLLLKAVTVKVVLPFQNVQDTTESIPGSLYEKLQSVVPAEGKVKAVVGCFIGKMRGCPRNRRSYLVLVNEVGIIFLYKRWFLPKAKVVRLSYISGATLKKGFLIDKLSLRIDGGRAIIVFLKNRSHAAARFMEAENKVREMEKIG